MPMPLSSIQSLTRSPRFSARIVIAGVVPNRGVANQPDLNLFGLHYLQQVSDADPPPFSTACSFFSIDFTSASDGVIVAVSDSGPGLPQANPERIFNAFYTTKPGGTGIGGVRDRLDSRRRRQQGHHLRDHRR